MTPSTYVVAIGLLVICGVQPAVGQVNPLEPRIDITYPPENSYVSGFLELQAIVAPDDVAPSRVQFFVDGRVLCVVESAPYRCHWDAGDSVRAHTVRVVAELSDGRRLIRQMRTAGVGYTENVEVESVLVPVLVSDGDRFIRGLTVDAFRLFEDGRAQRIDSVSAENVALDLVVAVDISESMAPSLPRVKQAVKRFMESLRPEDRVTLVAFNENVFTLSRRESTKEARQRALDRLSPWGGTALYDVLVKGMDLLARTSGRRALVVFSDGYDQSSRSTLESATRAVETGDAALYVIVLGQTAEAQRSKKTVEQLAQLSGGRAFFRDKLQDVDEDFGRITEELFNQYLLTYSSTNMNRNETWRRIKVEIAGKRYKVRARTGYRAVVKIHDRSMSEGKGSHP